MGQADEVDSFRMSLTGHLDELRSRLIYSIVAVFAIAGVAYLFREPLLQFLIGPLQDAFAVTALFGRVREWLVEEGFPPREAEAMARMLAPSGLIFIHPVEAFFSYIKLALYTGLLVGMPVVLFQVWKFVMPGLYRHERGYLVNFMAFGSLLFYTGVAFCFYMVLPLALTFLIGIGGPLLTPQLTVGNYISFVMLFMLVFGLSFELPLAMYILVRMGLVEHGTLIRQWRFIFAGAVVVGALFTPPDVFTQLAMASAMIVLYGVGLVLSRFAARARQGELEESEAAAGEGG